MNSWKVENPNRLLTEIKNKFLGPYTVQDLRWSIEHNRCFVNKQIEKFGSAALKKGDLLYFWPEKKPFFTKEADRILYEDESLLVYDKPPFLSSENLEKMTQCLLVHRLDRDTSGVIVLVKNPRIQSALEKQFKERSVQKEYLACVEGYPENEGIIRGKMAPLHKRQGAVTWKMASEGVWSQTEWRCMQRRKNSALLLCFPSTGRTHQIRVHLNHIGYPIVGDFTYGASQIVKGVFRPLLHAYRLAFTHPHTKKRLSYEAEIPNDLNAMCDFFFRAIPIP